MSFFSKRRHRAMHRAPRREPWDPPDRPKPTDPPCTQAWDGRRSSDLIDNVTEEKASDEVAWSMATRSDCLWQPTDKVRPSADPGAPQPKRAKVVPSPRLSTLAPTTGTQPLCSFCAARIRPRRSAASRASASFWRPRARAFSSGRWIPSSIRIRAASSKRRSDIGRLSRSSRSSSKCRLPSFVPAAPAVPAPRDAGPAQATCPSGIAILASRPAFTAGHSSRMML
jgi:hypothetical protein